MNLTEVTNIIADFSKNGVAIQRMTSDFTELAVTTKMLATVTGAADAEVAGLFSSLIVKAHYTQDSLKDLSNSLTKFNKMGFAVYERSDCRKSIARRHSFKRLCFIF